MAVGRYPQEVVMRRFRCAAVVFVVSASLCFPAVFSYAAPTPSPTPTIPVAGRPAPGKDLRKAFANAHPSPTRTAKRHKSKAPHRPSKLTVPAGYSAPVKRLLTDFKTGKLSPRRAADTASRMLRTLTPARHGGLPRRYSGGLSAEDLVAVSLLAGSSARSALLSVSDSDSLFSLLNNKSGVERPQRAPLAPTCVTEDGLELCALQVGHATVVYPPSRLSGHLADTSPADGIPDQAAETLDTLNRAWDYYHDVLGYNGPGDVVWAWNVATLQDDRAASLPGGVILAPAQYDAKGYLPVHELFHQFQWPYMSLAFPVLPPPSAYDPLGLKDWATAILELVNLSNINWWMEATAEWATTRYANFISQPTNPETSIAVAAAGSLGLFLATPSRKLASGDPHTDTRHYGELAMVDYFAQKTEDQFVRKTFETMQFWPYLDGYSHIDNTLADEYGYDTADLLPWAWHAQYLLCDPAERTYSQGRLTGWWINTWCGYVRNNPNLLSPGPPAGDVARPVHDATSLDAGSANRTVAPGGAWFLDLAGPANVRRVKVIDVTSSDPSKTTIWLDSWAGSPGEWCGGTQWNPAWYWDPESTDQVAHLELSSSPDCPNTTLMVVNSSLSGSDVTASATWGMYDDGAVISNGTIALGVNTRGSLGAQVRAPNGWEDVWTGIRDLATGTDLLANAWYPGDCLLINQPDWTEEDANEPAYEYVTCHTELAGGHRTGGLISFTHTASEATSILRSGSAIITQHYHPSANPRAYQLDVTVQIQGCDSGQTCDNNVVYRRLMPVNIRYPDPDENGDDTYWPDYVTYHHDPAQTDVIGYTNLTDEDSTELGTIATLPPPASVATVQSAGDSAYQGFAIDLAIHADTTGAANVPPQATLYFGAARTKDAAGVMTGIGARTYGLITPPEEVNETGITVFLAH